MTLQLLVRNDVEDFDKWKTAFDAAHETQSAAGLSLLQIWRETGNDSRVWYLFAVNDRDKAGGYMEGERARHLGERAGVTDGEYHFLETL